jgi:hypothetical protein
MTIFYVPVQSFMSFFSSIGYGYPFHESAINWHVCVPWSPLLYTCARHPLRPLGTMIRGYKHFRATWINWDCHLAQINYIGVYLTIWHPVITVCVTFCIIKKHWIFPYCVLSFVLFSAHTHTVSLYSYSIPTGLCNGHGLCSLCGKNRIVYLHC